MKKTALVLAIELLALGATGGAARSAEDDLGQDTYDAKCATCHGRDGRARTDIGIKLKTKDLTQPGLLKGLSDAQLEKQILGGTADKSMPAYQGKISTDELAALIKYLRSFQPK